MAVLDRGRVVAAGTPAELTGAGAPRVRFRLSAALDAGDAASLAAALRSTVAHGAGAAEAGDASGITVRDAGAGTWDVTGLAAPPDPRLVAALAAWCAERGLLLTELRVGAREPRGALPGAGGRPMTAARPLGTGTPATPAPRAAIVLALAANELRLALRRGESLLVTFVIPVGVLVLFSAFDLGSADAAGAPAVDRMLPASIALAVIAASMVSLAIATGFERAYGVLKRLGGSPAGTTSLVAAKTIGVAVVERPRSCCWSRSRPGSSGGGRDPRRRRRSCSWRSGSGRSAFAGLGLLMAGTLRAEATLALANLLFLVALVIGGIVVPLSRLPDAIAAVAAVLPPALLVRGCSRSGSGAGGDPTATLVLLAAWAVGLAGLAARTFRWD